MDPFRYLRVFLKQCSIWAVGCVLQILFEKMIYSQINLSNFELQHVRWASLLQDLSKSLI